VTATVGVVGPGAMGLGIVASLVRAGVRVVARDIRPEANARAQAAGATIAASPADVARAAPIVIVVVVDAQQVDDVLFGHDGIVAGGATGRVVMVASTLDPEYVRALPARCMRAGVTILDTPISGGPAKAHDGTMTIMVAGPREARERVAPVLEAIAARRFTISDRVGDAAATKIVNNLLAGANLAAAAEALALAEALGLDVRATADVIAASSGASWIFADRVPRALDGDYVPRAAARILAKDVGIACDVAHRARAHDTFAQAAKRAFDDTVAAGYGEDDDAAIVRRARERTATKPPG
jgi:3-hydroxyisobutyrate dehydrogenase-like beta-hydroxyacid dehydrogenase